MIPAEPNLYSHHWFEFFHVGIDRARTRQETEFICRSAPLPEFRKILDVCCGMGRHARALSNRGYSVVGIDRDADVIAKARELAGGPSYVVADIRDYQSTPETFDAAIVMGQSFGYFDAGTNRAVLQRLAESVRKRGRVILDLWNPDFFASQQGARELKTTRGVVRESKRFESDRLFVDLEYPSGGRETFEWQLFSPAQMISLAQSAGLALLRSRIDFDTAISPSPAKPRIQFLLERRS
jgi:SAM-dependent methyltransferase